MKEIAARVYPSPWEDTIPAHTQQNETCTAMLTALGGCA